MKDITPEDLSVIAEKTYTKSTSETGCCPPWDELSQQQKDLMTANVEKVHKTMQENGYAIMKVG